jgi:hypothetical protein
MAGSLSDLSRPCGTSGLSSAPNSARRVRREHVPYVCSLHPLRAPFGRRRLSPRPPEVVPLRATRSGHNGAPGGGYPHPAAAGPPGCVIPNNSEHRRDGRRFSAMTTLGAIFLPGLPPERLRSVGRAADHAGKLKASTFRGASTTWASRADMKGPLTLTWKRPSMPTLGCSTSMPAVVVLAGPRHERRRDHRAPADRLDGARRWWSPTTRSVTWCPASRCCTPSRCGSHSTRTGAD